MKRDFLSLIWLFLHLQHRDRLSPVVSTSLLLSIRRRFSSLIEAAKLHDTPMDVHADVDDVADAAKLKDLAATPGPNLLHGSCVFRGSIKTGLSVVSTFIN